MRELIKTWRRCGFTLRIWDINQRDHLGKWKLAYQLKDGEQVIFSGDDFACSPLHATDSLETVYSLLSFLSLQDGDTDADYFASYTAEQLAWRDSSRCEELAIIVCDAEERAERKRRR